MDTDPLSAGISSAANLAGQIMANSANRAAAGKSMRWQDANRDKSMAFQREMRATAYQTSVQDMKKAGLNPMLLASKGFAPSQSPGAQPSGNTPLPKQENVVHSALSAAFMKAQIENLKSQSARNYAEAGFKKPVGDLATEGYNMYSTAKEVAGDVGKKLGGAAYGVTSGLKRFGKKLGGYIYNSTHKRSN